MLPCAKWWVTQDFRVRRKEVEGRRKGGGAGIVATLMPELDPLISASPTVRYILPHAPTRPITLNGGMAMPGWFDIASLDARGKEDADGLAAAASRVEEILAAEVASG